MSDRNAPGCMNILFGGIICCYRTDTDGQKTSGLIGAGGGGGGGGVRPLLKPYN